MTVIEKSHCYLETGQALAEVLDALKELKCTHPKWLQDAKEALEKNDKPGHFTISLPNINSMEKHFENGDIYLTYFGLRQLDILFYRKKHYFDDSKNEEGRLTLAIKDAIEAFQSHADDYVEEKLNAMNDEDRQAFFMKLRKWSLLRIQGANATNEISTLICKEGTQKPHPILLEISLAQEIYFQAKYQQESHSKDLSEEEQKALNDFIANFEKAKLDFWQI